MTEFTTGLDVLSRVEVEFANELDDLIGVFTKAINGFRKNPLVKQLAWSTKYPRRGSRSKKYRKFCVKK